MRVPKFIEYLFSREPDVMIGGTENPYLLRWHIIPRNPLFNIYLHKFMRDDDDRALHDHPWASVSIVLSGSFKEHVFLRPGHSFTTYYIMRWKGNIVYRKPTHAHRIELLRTWDKKPIPAWTIFITGPRIRRWGFHCLNGWRHWKEFTAPGDSTRVGKGCD